MVSISVPRMRGWGNPYFSLSGALGPSLSLTEEVCGRLFSGAPKSQEEGWEGVAGETTKSLDIAEVSYGARGDVGKAFRLAQRGIKSLKNSAI